MIKSKFCYSGICLLILSTLFVGKISLIGQTADTSNSLTKLSTEIDRLLNGNGIGSAKYGICIYSLDKKEHIFQKNQDVLLTPASCTKLITSVATYETFGMGAYIRTYFATDGKVVSDSIIDGNLYLIGEGDAWFSLSDLDRLIDNLYISGIRMITGKVFADGSFFDNKTDRMIYSGDHDRVENLQPISGLSLDKNIATVLVSSGGGSASPNVQIIPNSTNFIKVNNAKIVQPRKRLKKSSKKKKHASVIEEYDSHYDGFGQRYGDAVPKRKAATSRVTVSTKLREDGKQVFYINGSIQPNKSMAYQVYINEPASAIAGVLEYRIKTLGIKFSGHVGVGSYHRESDKKITVLNEFRRKQFDLLYNMNKRSDNYIAENLFKRVGATNGGHVNTASMASHTDMLSLSGLGIDTSSLCFYDGSGLSRRNKISAKLLCDMLAKVSEKDYFQEFDSTLAIAGFDGTISKRFHNTKARLNLHAKTGTHSNVSALAGYVRTTEGERLCFAFIFNGPSVGNYKYIENEIGRLLAEYPNIIVKQDVKKRKR